MRSSVAAPSVSSSIEAVFADEAAFRAWYEYALPRVHRYLFHRCGRDRALAEELTQETFVAAIRSSRRFSGRGDAVSWVIGIARHRLADHFRRLERQERGVVNLASRGQLEAVMPWSGPRDDELAAALAALPAMQRAAVVLRYLDDLPVREVARLLGRSEKAVESLLSRGRDALRRTYEGIEG
jgi:RNA polymerase sigma-70 factor (ECF subfamily)